MHVIIGKLKCNEEDNYYFNFELKLGFDTKALLKLKFQKSCNKN